MAVRIAVGAGYGLRDWIVQRATALVMALAGLVLFAVLIRHWPDDYESWRRMFAPGWVRGAVFLFVAALAWHGFIGVREICMDYIKHDGLRLLKLIGAAAWFIFCLIWAAQILLASPAGASGYAGSPTYVGWEKREIKALSPEAISGYLSGDGMGYALAAELNHYPGPRHVLELAGPLALSAAQRTQSELWRAQMRAEAIPLGEAIIAKEAELDAAFADGSVDEETLAALVGDIAARQGALRTAHLKYHLRMKRLLSPAQIARYDNLRGYGHSHRHSHRR